MLTSLLRNGAGLFHGADFRVHQALGTGMAPTFLIYQCTVSCGSRCSFCSIWKLPVHNELSLEELDKIIADPFWSKLRWVNLTGGEPFNRRDYAEVAGMLQKNLPALEMISTPTNGFAPRSIIKKTTRALELLGGRTNLAINVSIDNIGAKHDLSRGIPKGYEKCMASLQGLRELKASWDNLEVGTETVITSANIDDLGHIYDTLRPMTDHVNFTPVVINESEYYKEQDASLGLTSKETGKMEAFFDRLRLEEPAYAYYWSKVLEIKKGQGRSFPCLGGYKTIYLDAHGNVYPCLVAPKHFHMGNAREDSVEALWMGSQGDMVRQRIKEYDFCGVCTNNCDIVNNLKEEMLDFAAYMGTHPRVFSALVKQVGDGRLAKYV